LFPGQYALINPFYRAQKVNVGSLMLKYGGGHNMVGTYQVAPDTADAVLAEILKASNAAK
jgi:hypothetical protein